MIKMHHSCLPESSVTMLSTGPSDVHLMQVKNSVMIKDIN